MSLINLQMVNIDSPFLLILSERTRTTKQNKRENELNLPFLRLCVMKWFIYLVESILKNVHVFRVCDHVQLIALIRQLSNILGELNEVCINTLL